MEREREGKEEGGSGRGEMVGKGEGGLDLDICLGAPEFIVTPLLRDLPLRAPLRRFSATPAHRSAPLHPIFVSLRSDNKVKIRI